MAMFTVRRGTTNKTNATELPHMKFIPLDIATFLVPSRTRHDVCHILSLVGDTGCSCEAYEHSAPFNTCAHYREAMRRRQRGKLSIIVAMKGRA